jgi:hypothetical protein
MARDLDGQKVAKINEFKENLLSISVIDRIKFTKAGVCVSQGT